LIIGTRYFYTHAATGCSRTEISPGGHGLFTFFAGVCFARGQVLLVMGTLAVLAVAWWVIAFLSIRVVSGRQAFRVWIRSDSEGASIYEQEIAFSR
jgi:hypothetical protein